MTTTDARKRNRDMADAHETARERDAKAKAGHPIEWFVYDETQTFTREHLTEWQHAYLAPANPRPGDVVQYLGHATTQARDAAWMLGALDGTGGPRDRTHDDQETDTMTDQPEPYDFHDEAHRALLNDNLSKGWQASLHALLAIHDTLTEIRDRMPERVEARVAPFDPDVIAANLKAIKHEAETPMRGHGECCPTERTDWLDEPIPVPRPEPADITEEPPVGSFVVDHGADNVWERREGGWFNHSTAENRTYPWAAVNAPDYRPLRPATDADRERVGLPVEPAPADVDPDESLIDQMVDVIFGDGALSHEGLIEARREIAANAACVARKRIEAERIDAEAKRDQWKADVRDAAIARAEKALVDLARVTGERDAYKRAKAENDDRFQIEAHDWRERADKAQAKADRYDALRADVWVVAEVIDSDGDDTLRLMHTEALSPWMRSGMLRAATLIADEAINEGWCGDGDDD